MTTFRFTTNEVAVLFARRGKANMVVLGDDNHFWVVTVADADRLVKAGYELAPIAF